MGTCYGQLSLEERSVIGILHEDGHSRAAIARRIDRHPSTVGRELRRNAKRTKAWPGGYDASRAHALAQRRRRWDKRFKLVRQPDLARRVRDLLAMGWSPEQIAGRLARDDGRTVISHESIYRFVYHRTAQKDPSWHRLLPRAKNRRGRMKRGGGSPADRIRDRVGVAERPETANDRAEPGHWEVDLMICRNRRNVLVTCERTSRYVTLHHRPTKQARPVAKHLLRQFRALPAPLRRSATFDNGTEFADHWKLNKRLAMPTFFCDTHSPWQKGGVENAIGRLRRFLPRGCDLDAVPAGKLKAIAKRYNRTPRKCLGYRTPEEVFHALL